MRFFRLKKKKKEYISPSVTAGWADCGFSLCSLILYRLVHIFPSIAILAAVCLIFYMTDTLHRYNPTACSKGGKSITLLPGKCSPHVHASWKPRPSVVQRLSQTTCRDHRMPSKKYL